MSLLGQDQSKIFREEKVIFIFRNYSFYADSLDPVTVKIKCIFQEKELTVTF